VRTLLLLAVYLAFLGVRPARLAPVGHDLSVSIVANDTDADDDVLDGPCVHCQGLDSGFQNFDCANSPAIDFRAESRRLDGGAMTAPERLDDGGLFRPPRPSLV
jgi:hypothetical protein